MTVAFVGLGANLGEARSRVKQACLELDALPRTRLIKASSLYLTAPVGHAGQPDFVNAVAQLDTDLPARELLAELLGIEARHGRSRSFRNAPRTLDLDLLLYGNCTIEAAELTLPHPRMHERAFVLAPLVEIAPQAVIPGRGAAADLLERCRGQGVERIG